LTLLSDGVDPATVTYKQAQPAFRKLQKAADNGQIRKFTGNDYQDELVNGDFAVCVGWSGDVAQLTLENEDLRFVIPDEGGERWADVMAWVTPSKRRKQVAAWMDFFYDQANAARLANFIQFIPPVAGIEDELAALDPQASTNPLIFPPEDVQAKLKSFKTLGPKEEERFDERFAEIIGA
jgi:spermidine/putrescine transport system substrate-binding protein